MRWSWAARIAADRSCNDKARVNHPWRGKAGIRRAQHDRQPNDAVGSLAGLCQEIMLACEEM